MCLCVWLVFVGCTFCMSKYTRLATDDSDDPQRRASGTGSFSGATTGLVSSCELPMLHAVAQCLADAWLPISPRRYHETHPSLTMLAEETTFDGVTASSSAADEPGAPLIQSPSAALLEEEHEIVEQMGLESPFEPLKHEAKMSRSLTLPSSVSFIVGSMIGSGIFSSPGLPLTFPPSGPL